MIEDSKKLKFRKKKLEDDNKKNRFGWIAVIFVLSFFLSVVMTLLSEGLMDATNNIIVAFVVLISIIFIGILFDIIGSAVIAADPKPLYAMASRKRYGTKLAIKFLKNADKMASICNDVIGDTCGVISGTAVAYIITSLSFGENWIFETIYSLGLTSLVSSFMVAGKALGKKFAIKQCNNIIYRFAVVISVITFRKG